MRLLETIQTENVYTVELTQAEVNVIYSLTGVTTSLGPNEAADASESLYQFSREHTTKEYCLNDIDGLRIGAIDIRESGNG